MPALPAEAALPCPPLPPIADRTMGAIAVAHGETVSAYAECQRRHSATVQAYERVRATLSPEVPE